jgi:1,6-anhydro-N-acetylmuramate kinase
MTEWPDIDGLLDAVRFHLETNVLPVIKTDARLYFQTLVALNLLKIGQREIAQSHDLLRQEWTALNKLSGEVTPAPEQEQMLAREIAARRTALAKDTRSGKYDSPDQEALLVAYLEETVAAQLALNNPSLSARMAKEAADQSYAL